MTINGALFSSDSSEWETPQDLFDALNEEFHFTLDAAASPQNAKCERYYTKEDDALTKPWPGQVWCNPPYGRQIGSFVEHAYYESTDGAQVVMLLPSRTDTSWWHKYVMRSADIMLIKGRLRFVGAKNSAPFPSCIVVFDESSRSLPEVYSINTKGQLI